MTTNRFKDKKILILAGKPIGSVDIVKYAQSLGAYVIVTDYLDQKDSPAKQIADECWNISTADVDTLAQKALQTGVDAVFTGVHDFNINMAQKLCEKLNLPFYATKKQLSQTSDKNIYKNLFKQYDVPVIEEYSINSKDIQYPVIVKPVDSSGAYGVKICNNQNELRKNYNSALEFSESKKVLIERYIDDEEVTIEYLLQDGDIQLIGMADRHIVQFEKGILPLPDYYIWPSKYLSHFENNFNEKIINALKSLDLKNGMLFIQAKVDGKDIKPYDMGFRLSGTQEYRIFEKICGVNPLKMMTNYALTGKMSDQICKVKADYDIFGANVTFLAKPSQIGSFIGLDDVSAMNGVVAVVKNKHENETIPDSALGTLNQVVLRVFVIADNRASLIEKIKEIRSKVQILDISGHNILYEEQNNV